MARVADQSERNSDMVEFLEEIIDESPDDLPMDVKNLLSVGFKNLISAQRSAWKTRNTKKLMPFCFCDLLKGRLH